MQPFQSPFERYAFLSLGIASTKPSYLLFRTIAELTFGEEPSTLLEQAMQPFQSPLNDIRKKYGTYSSREDQLSTKPSYLLFETITEPFGKLHFFLDMDKLCGNAVSESLNDIRKDTRHLLLCLVTTKLSTEPSMY